MIFPSGCPGRWTSRRCAARSEVRGSRVAVCEGIGIVELIRTVDPEVLHEGESEIVFGSCVVFGLDIVYGYKRETAMCPDVREPGNTSPIVTRPIPMDEPRAGYDTWHEGEASYSRGEIFELIQ